MTSTNLPANAGFTARVVYVQECPECRLVVEALCLVWVANPSIGCFQCIASKKNHCCESGDALPRVAQSAREQASMFHSEQEAKESEAEREERARLARAELARRGRGEHGWCIHGNSVGCCLLCEPISDTNGSNPEDVDELLIRQLPNGFDTGGAR